MATAIIIVFFITIVVLWFKLYSASSELSRRDLEEVAAQRQVQKLQKVIKNSKKNKVVELELATTKQIIHELRHRPNQRFLLLVPHQTQDDIYVETHICNIHPNDVLMMLKVAHDGVSDHWDMDEEGPEGGEGEGEEWDSS